MNTKKIEIMPSYIWEHTLPWEDLSQDLPSRLQHLTQNIYLDSIEKYGVSTKQCTKYYIFKNMVHALSKTFNNIGEKHHKEHYLTLREGFSEF